MSNVLFGTPCSCWQYHSSNVVIYCLGGLRIFDTNIVSSYLNCVTDITFANNCGMCDLRIIRQYQCDIQITTFKDRSVYNSLVWDPSLFITLTTYMHKLSFLLFVRLKLLFDLLWFSPQNSISLSWHQWQWQCNCNLLQFKYNTNSILLHNLFLYIFFKSLNFVIIVQYYTYTDDLIPILIL